MPRGFANMTPDQLRAASRKGGVNAHKAGTAHEWTSEEARRAGKMGGRSTQAKLKAQTEEFTQRAAEAFGK